MYPKKLIVIGGGAAGFFCAINAARMNKSLQVMVLEKTNKLLSKVKVSGGGRCNVTHALFDVPELSQRYPRGTNFVKKTFHQFYTEDTIQWFEERGVAIKKEPDGRMFPITDSSQTIIDCFLKEANKYGIDIRMNAEVKRIEKNAMEASETFDISLHSGQVLTADYVCIATGGYAKASQFEWLSNLGHQYETPMPSLFTFNLPKHPITALMGVSVEEVRVKIEGTKLTEEGPLLITHWGLSGPCILRLSAWGARELAAKNYAFTPHINWLPKQTDQSIKHVFQQQRNMNPTQKLSNYKSSLPQRLWEFLLEQSGISIELRWADLPSKTENKLIKNMVDYTVDVRGKTTFKEEFVTAGGINLSEIDANTMMSKKVKNLFFAGEIMNVDGITGGFNFQHAWTSGWLAAKAIANSVTVI